MPDEIQTTALLLEAVAAVRDLCRALIDTMPPDVQREIADIQEKMHKAVKEFQNG